VLFAASRFVHQTHFDRQGDQNKNGSQGKNKSGNKQLQMFGHVVSIGFLA
jgi:hypothetical protein